MPYHLNAPASELTGRYGAGAGTDRLVRLTEVKSPSSTYIVVEENDNRDYNMDAWAFDPYKFILIDTIAVFHNNITMFGYADGHSERKTWEDSRTQRWSNEIRDGTRYPDMTGLSDPDNADIRWLAAALSPKALTDLNSTQPPCRSTEPADLFVFARATFTPAAPPRSCLSPVLSS